MIAWKKIFTPKAQGGLGLWRTLPLNKDFFEKLGWNVLNS